MTAFSAKVTLGAANQLINEHQRPDHFWLSLSWQHCAGCYHVIGKRPGYRGSLEDQKQGSNSILDIVLISHKNVIHWFIQ